MSANANTTPEEIPAETPKKGKAWKYVAIAAVGISLLFAGLFVGSFIAGNGSEKSVQGGSTESVQLNLDPDFQSEASPVVTLEPSAQPSAIPTSSPSAHPSVTPSNVPSSEPSYG